MEEKRKGIIGGEEAVLSSEDGRAMLGWMLIPLTPEGLPGRAKAIVRLGAEILWLFS